MTTSVQRTDPRLARSRAAVVSAAADLLVRAGVHAVTVEAVVRRSGVARSTIYRHFATRGELVAAAFTHLLPPLPQVPAGGDLETRLLAVVVPKTAEMASVTYASLLPSLLAEAAGDPELTAVRDRFVHAQQAPLAEVLTDAVAREEIAADLDVDEACSTLLGPSLFQRLVLGRPPADGATERTVRAFVDRYRPHR